MKNNCENIFEIKWYDNIHDIDATEWDKMFGNNPMKSFGMLEAMQDAHIEHSAFYYLKISWEGKTVALAPCFFYRLQLDVLAPVWIKKIIKHIRKYFPHFMMMKILGIGSLASTCDEHIAIDETLPEEIMNQLKETFNVEIKKKIKEVKATIIFVKEVPENQMPRIRNIFDSEFYFYYSLPNCIVPVNGICKPYPSALRYKERTRCKIAKKEFNKSYQWEVVYDYESLVNTFFPLYSNVFAKSKVVFEFLNEKFFENFSKTLRGKSFLLIAKDVNEKVKVMELVVEDNDKLIPMYLGIDYYGLPDTKTLYLSTIFKTIEEAEVHGKKCVMFGQTSYYSKVLSGALTEKLYLGFYSHKPFVQFLIKKVFKYLFEPTKVPWNVYKKSIETKIKEEYAQLGFIFDNI